MISDHSVSNRIAILRFVMIFGIVVLHTPNYVPIAEVGSGWFDLTKAFFQSAVFRSTVPVLTFISGFLLFGSALDQQPRKLASKKIKSILVPFLFFNTLLLAAAFAAQARFNITTSASLIPFDAMTWMNAAFGITSSPINYPLNFLRDLIVLMLLAPLFGLLLRKSAVLGLVLVTLVFLNNFDGHLILRADMPIIFYIGGMAAIRKWDMTALDKFAVPALALFLALCAAIIYFKVANTTYLRLAAPFLIWPAASLLHNTRFGDWCAAMSRYSFFLFVAHAPVLMACWLIYGKSGQAFPYPLFWFFAPVAVTAIVIAVYEVCMRLFPTAFRAVLGTSGARKRPAPATGQAEQAA